MTVMTTSQRLVDKLKVYRCRGDHEHQSIEGQTYHNGERMSRSTFSENYPRKFARIVAGTVCKIQKPKEIPYRMEESILSITPKIQQNLPERDADCLNKQD